MMPVQRKIFVLLLSLMLGLVPMQGIFAAEVDTHLHGGVASMNDLAHDQMPEMAMDCDHCELGNCCDGSSCSVQHCASCTQVAVPQALLADHLKTQINDQSAIESHFSDSLLVSLFRPPRV